MNQLTLSDGIFAGLFTRSNCTKALEWIQILQSRSGVPYTFKTRLGWCVVGPLNKTKRNKTSYKQIAVNKADTKEVGKNSFQVKKKVEESDLPDMLQQMYNHQFTECQHLESKDVADMSHICC